MTKLDEFNNFAFSFLSSVLEHKELDYYFNMKENFDFLKIVADCNYVTELQCYTMLGGNLYFDIKGYPHITKVGLDFMHKYSNDKKEKRKKLIREIVMVIITSVISTIITILITKALIQ